MRIFLGGTCNESRWRDRLVENLDKNILWFNPVVADWTSECMVSELRERAECDFCLYVITPLMTGVYSIAEVIDDSNKRPKKTVFCYLEVDGERAFTAGQRRSLDQVGKMVVRNGGTWIGLSLKSVADFFNKLVGER